MHLPSPSPPQNPRDQAPSKRSAKRAKYFAQKKAEKAHFKSLQELAEKNDAGAQHALGEHYLDLARQKPDKRSKYIEMAMQYLERAAAQAFLPAMESLGKLHGEYSRLGGYTKALEWYLKAADMGSAAAQFEVANLYLGLGDVAPNFKMAKTWCAKSIEQRNPEANALLSNIRKFEKLHCDAEGDQAEIENLVNFTNHYGVGFTIAYNKSNIQEYLLRAAAKDNVLAMESLGTFYTSGPVEHRSDQKAFYWYQIAAEKGSPAAQYELAYIYCNGIGTQINIRLAIHWCKRSAEQGNLDAHNYLQTLNLYKARWGHFLRFLLPLWALPNLILFLVYINPNKGSMFVFATIATIWLLGLIQWIRKQKFVED